MKEEEDGADIFSDAEATPVAATGAAALSPALQDTDTAPHEASGSAAKASNGTKKQQQAAAAAEAAQSALKASAGSSSGAATAAPAATDEADEERRQRLRQVCCASAAGLLYPGHASISLLNRCSRLGWAHVAWQCRPSMWQHQSGIHITIGSVASGQIGAVNLA